MEDAIRGQLRWNVSTVYHVKCRIVAMFNWAVGEELLAANPIRGLKKPQARSRGPETVPTDNDLRRLVEAAPPYLGNVLSVLHETGARPAEVLSVTASQFDAGARVWVLRDHKTAGRTGRGRVIHLTDRVVNLCGELAAKYPTGPLFRTARGKPFPPAYYLARLVRDLRRKLGLPESVIPYGLRHGFATDALSKGVPDTVVAALLGHTSTQMIHKHYSHVSERSRELKAALAQVR